MLLIVVFIENIIYAKGKQLLELQCRIDNIKNNLPGISDGLTCKQNIFLNVLFKSLGSMIYDPYTRGSMQELETAIMKNRS